MNAIHAGRLTPLLPLAALLLAGVAMQAKLLPVKPMRLEIPSGAEIGAAPQQSVPPAAALVFSPPTPVLPRDSVPDETAPAASTPGVAMAPPSLDGPLAGAAAGAAYSPALTLPGAGNLALRPSGTHAVAVLIANLMQQLERLRAHRAASLRHPVALKPVSRPARPPTSITAAIPQASPLTPGLGGAAPLRGELGGLAPLAERSAPAINGATLKRKF